jgi:hypothetical protein
MRSAGDQIFPVTVQKMSGLFGKMPAVPPPDRSAVHGVVIR